MDLDTVKLYSEIAASLATVLGVLFAVGAVYIGWRQIASQRQTQAEATSKQLLARSIELCIQYPEFAEPSDYTNFDGKELVAYKWFVGAMLNTFEEIIIYSKDERWRSEFKLIASLHRDYLSSSDFVAEDLGSFGSDFRALIFETTSNNGERNT